VITEKSKHVKPCNARTLTAWEQDGEMGMTITGPRGKVYASVFLDSEDLLVFAAKVTEAARARYETVGHMRAEAARRADS
jgi:hypothetical protein